MSTIEDTSKNWSYENRKDIAFQEHKAEDFNDEDPYIDYEHLSDHVNNTDKEIIKRVIEESGFDPLDKGTRGNRNKVTDEMIRDIVEQRNREDDSIYGKVNEVENEEEEIKDNTHKKDDELEFLDDSISMEDDEEDDEEENPQIKKLPKQKKAVDQKKVDKKASIVPGKKNFSENSQSQEGKADSSEEMSPEVREVCISYNKNSP